MKKLHITNFGTHFLIAYGGVHKRRPQVGGEGVEECVTECDSRVRDV